MLACTYLVYPFLRGWGAPACGGVCAQALTVRAVAGDWRAPGPSLNSRLSSLEPALDEQARSDLIHGCLHAVMAVVPEPEGEDGSQEVPWRGPHRLPASVGARGKAPKGGGVTSGAGPPLSPGPVPGHHARP